MNTLPIQMPSPTNAAADASSKTRQADEPSTGNAFQQTLKDEIADRRQSDADKVAAPNDAGKAAVAPRAQASAEADTDKQGKEVIEPALDGDPNAMAQLLALTGQFMQSGAKPEVPPESTAGLDSELASGPIMTAETVSLVTSGKSAPTTPMLLPQLQAGGTASAKNGKTETAKDESFEAKMDQANLAQQPARGVPEKTAQAVLAAIESSALKHGGADQNKEVQLQPASSTAFASLQQAGLDKLEAKTSASADRIAPQVGTTGWNQAIGQKVVWMAKNDQMSASLSLNPPDLGPMKVVISVSDNIATASFVSAHQDVRQALETALPRLREMLGEAGIQLGQAHVGAGTSGEYGAQAEQQQNGRHTSQSDVTSQSLLLDTHVPAQSVRQGLVDTFA